MTFLNKLFGAVRDRNMPSTRLPEVADVELTKMDIGPQMQLIRGWESQVHSLFKIGNVLETTHDDVSFHCLSHPQSNSYYDTQQLPAGTKFVVKELPQMNEGGFYDAVVLIIDGRQALVDIHELYNKVRKSQ
jgi:hypothetical protein